MTRPGPEIKLQMVLQPSERDGGDRLALEDRLARLGIGQTARGLATLSAEITPDAYARLWGAPPATRSGFTTGMAGCRLAVPADLVHAIASITTVPRHSTLDEGPP